MHFVARDDDVRTAFRDDERFSSRDNFSTDTTATTFPAMITQLDPPDHTPLRRVLMPPFMPGAVTALEAEIRRVVKDAVDAFVPGKTVDLMSTIACVVPGRVVYRMIGLTDSDRSMLQGWADTINARLPEPVVDLDEFHALCGYLMNFIASRRAGAASTDDIASRLLEERIDGRALTDDEVLAHLLQLIAAGTETTTSLIGNLMFRLLSARSRWERLVSDRSLVPIAIEESLRLDAPIQWLLRTSNGNQQLGGHPICAGDRVVLGIQSANRDEAAWGTDADDFSLDREHPKQHLSFGYGIHLCLGAPVARLETRAVLEELLERYPGMTLQPGFAWERWKSVMLLRPVRLDVVLGAT